MAAKNPIRYRGYYYDVETKFYYLQSRYYDPRIGRFINADGYASTGQGVLGANMFAYCGNEPVGHSDPRGDFAGDQWSFSVDGVRYIWGCAGAGAIVGATVGVAVADEEGYTPSDFGYWCTVLSYTALFALYGLQFGVTTCDSPRYYASWQEAEQATRDAIGSVQRRSERTFETQGKNRIFDAYNPKTGVAGEAKYGYQGCSEQILSELERDAWLLRNKRVASVEWHFYYSVSSESIGPSGTLLAKLQGAGITVIIHR